MGSNPIKSCFMNQSKNSHFKVKVNSKSYEISSNQNSIESYEDLGIEIDEKYRGSLIYAKDKIGNIVYKRRKNIIITNRIYSIIKQYNITESIVIKIWKFFKVLDSKSTGYINKYILYLLINEDVDFSSLTLYINQFFNEMSKENNEKASFEEFLPSIISYCLYSTYHIIKYTFNILDSDSDGFISREEIVNFLETKINNNRLLLYNHAETIKYTNYITRSDRISIEDFEKICKRFPFIYYQGIRFQELLRERYISNAFWKDVLKQVTTKHLNNIKMNEKIKIDAKIEELQENIIKEKVKLYRKKMEVYEKNRKKDKGKEVGNDDLFYMEEFENEKNNSDDEIKSFDVSICFDVFHEKE